MLGVFTTNRVGENGTKLGEMVKNADDVICG